MMMNWRMEDDNTYGSRAEMTMRSHDTWQNIEYQLRLSAVEYTDIKESDPPAASFTYNDQGQNIKGQCHVQLCMFIFGDYNIKLNSLSQGPQ